MEGNEVQERKKNLRNFNTPIDIIIRRMILYLCKRKRDSFLPKKELIKEKLKMEKKKMDSSTYLDFVSRFGVGDVVKGYYYNAKFKKKFVNFRVESLDAFGMYVCLVNKKGQSDRELGLAEEDTLYSVRMDKDVEYPDCGCDRKVIVYTFIVEDFVINDVGEFHIAILDNPF